MISNNISQKVSPGGSDERLLKILLYSLP